MLFFLFFPFCFIFISIRAVSVSRFGFHGSPVSFPIVHHSSIGGGGNIFSIYTASWDLDCTETRAPPGLERKMKTGEKVKCEGRRKYAYKNYQRIHSRTNDENMRSWMKTSHGSGSKIFINFYVPGYWTAEVEWKKKRIEIKNESREKCNEFYSFLSFCLLAFHAPQNVMSTTNKRSILIYLLPNMRESRIKMGAL